MEPGLREDPESILRPLRAAGDAVGDLRAGSLEPERARERIVQVAFGVENSLRRLLRDEPAVALPVRLRALAPDELRAEEVLSELRQHDRISIELAALVHELLGMRSSLREGEPPVPADGALAVQAADRLEREVLEAPHPPPTAVEPPLAEPPLATPPPDAWDEAPVEGGGRERDRPPIPVSGWVAGLVGLLLVLGLAFWWNSRPDTAELERGIALFRSGAYADAASHFFRYAEQNPDEVVPHLYLARIHRRLDRLDLAEQSLRTAIGIAPRDPGVHRELGFYLIDSGRYDLAVDRFREALTLDPEASQAWIGLVRALREAGRPEAAARVLQQAPAEVRALLSEEAAPVERP